MIAETYVLGSEERGRCDPAPTSSTFLTTELVPSTSLCKAEISRSLASIHLYLASEEVLLPLCLMPAASRIAKRSTPEADRAHANEPERLWTAWSPLQIASIS